MGLRIGGTLWRGLIRTEKDVPLSAWNRQGVRYRFKTFPGFHRHHIGKYPATIANRSADPGIRAAAYKRAMPAPSLISPIATAPGTALR
jgi:hypothetical protein